MKTKNILSRHGIPEKIISDNGRQFTSRDFQDFAEKWGFVHVTSSPHYPQANGMAERAVKEAKNILSQEDPFLALLIHRSTPTSTTGSSPAQLACGRNFRTNLPCLPSILDPEIVDRETVHRRDSKAKLSNKFHFDRRHGAQSLPELLPGDTVLQKLDGEKSWSDPATVLRQCAPRSYEIKTQKGLYRRNRKHLMRTPRPPPTLPVPVPAINPSNQPSPIHSHSSNGGQKSISASRTPASLQLSPALTPVPASQQASAGKQQQSEGLQTSSPGHQPIQHFYAEASTGQHSLRASSTSQPSEPVCRDERGGQPSTPKMTRRGRIIKTPERYK